MIEVRKGTLYYCAFQLDLQIHLCRCIEPAIG